jgi:hypothetical protein
VVVPALQLVFLRRTQDHLLDTPESGAAEL